MTTTTIAVPRDVPDGYMPIPTAEQIADALDGVRCYHDMSAELIAPRLLANLLAATTVKESLSVAGVPAGVPDGWIACANQLPPIRSVLSEPCMLEGQPVPTLYRSAHVITFDGHHVSSGIVEWFHGKMPVSGVTHWMALPAAPEVNNV